VIITIRTTSPRSFARADERIVLPIPLAALLPVVRSSRKRASGCTPASGRPRSATRARSRRAAGGSRSPRAAATRRPRSSLLAELRVPDCALRVLDSKFVLDAALVALEELVGGFAGGARRSPHPAEQIARGDVGIGLDELVVARRSRRGPRARTAARGTRECGEYANRGANESIPVQRSTTPRHANRVPALGRLSARSACNDALRRSRAGSLYKLPVGLPKRPAAW
jgi:hypothetical protein